MRGVMLFIGRGLCCSSIPLRNPGLVVCGVDGRETVSSCEVEALCLEDCGFELLWGEGGVVREGCEARLELWVEREGVLRQGVVDGGFAGWSDFGFHCVK